MAFCWSDEPGTGGAGGQTKRFRQIFPASSILELAGAALGLAGGPSAPVTVPVGGGGGAFIGGAVGTLTGTPGGGYLGYRYGSAFCASSGSGGGNRGSGGGGSRKWTITNPVKTKVIGGRKYMKDGKTGLWWSQDTAGHGGSAWKVFTEGPDESLHWFADADEQGNFITGKWKSPAGTVVE